MLKSKEVSTCLIIVKLHSCVYRTSADRTVVINCHKCRDTLFAERCMSTWHESNVIACCNETTVAYENASRPTFVRPISVSHLGLFHARTIVSSRSQCYFSRISSNCTVIPYSIFPYLYFPPVHILPLCTSVFHTCIFQYLQFQRPHSDITEHQERLVRTWNSMTEQSVIDVSYPTESMCWRKRQTFWTFCCRLV